MNLKLILTGMLICLGCGSVLGDSLVPSPPSIAAKSYVLIEAGTGDVLVEFNSKERSAPASLTKIMTSYVAAAELDAGRLGWNDPVSVSIKAWRAEGSRMFIQEGTQVSVADLLRGIIVVSGNDSSIAIAEHISGTEEAFAEYMNEHAQRLGLEDSSFKNSTGLDQQDHYSTAFDHAQLTRHLITEYPDVYALYSELEYTYNDIKQPNRNRLLVRDSSVDGVKTGYTQDAGYNLVAAAERNGLRLISAVLGASSTRVRENETAKLLNYGFRNYTRHTAVQKSQKLDPVRILFGVEEEVTVAASEAFDLLMVRGTEDSLLIERKLNEPLEAPIAVGDQLGVINVVWNGELKGSVPVVATASVEEVGFFERIWRNIKMTFE